MNLFLSIGIPTGLGYVIIQSLSKNKLPVLVKLALGFGLGLGILTLWMLCLNTLGLPLTRAYITFPILALLFVFGKISLSKNPDDLTETDFPSSLTRPNLLMYGSMLCLKAYITLNIFLCFWRALSIPIAAWDAIATIAFKAKVFFYEQTIPPLNQLPHATYPLLVPLSEAWVAFNLGHWDDTIVQIIFPVIFLAFLIIQYYFMAFFSTRMCALSSVALLISSNLLTYHATISYRDIILMYYICTAIMLLFIWNRSQNKSLLFLASLFAGFATFTKLEGTAYLLICTIIFIIFSILDKKQKGKIKDLILFIVPAYTICLLFHVFKILTHATKDGQGHIDKTHFVFSLQNLTLIPDVVESFFEHLLFTGNWNVLWGVLLVVVAFSLTRKSTLQVYMLMLALFLFFGLYFIVALFSSNFVWIAGDLSYTTLSRLLMHFFPLCVCLISLASYSVLNDSD